MSSSSRSSSSAYTAVIFSSQRHAAAGDGYDEMAVRMVKLATEQPGYRGVESARGTDGFGITVSYWDDDASAAAWKTVAEHELAQRIGRERWYESYTVRVATVTREYGGSRQPGDTTASMIYHLALAPDWEAAQADGAYRVSTRGLGLDEVGFIHCSGREQLVPVAETWYSDTDDVVVLTIDPSLVSAEIRLEPGAPDSDELFPHIYGELPVDAVVAVTAWRRGDGRTDPPV